MNNLADDYRDFQVDRPASTSTTCPCTLATEAPRDTYAAGGELVREVIAMAGGTWPDQVTMYAKREIELTGLDDDPDDPPRLEYAVVGSLRELRREDDALVGTAHFSSGRAGTALRADVDGGHAVGIVLQTSVHESHLLRPGESLEFGGRVYRADDDAPLRLVTRWKAYHALAVPAGTDDVGQFGESARGHFDAWVSALPAGDPLTHWTRELLIDRGMPAEFYDVAALRWAKRNLRSRAQPEFVVASPFVWDYEI